ncbi:MAG: serine hydrolase domain-containing protein, partial [Gemmatirosa sp.]
MRVLVGVEMDRARWQAAHPKAPGAPDQPRRSVPRPIATILRPFALRYKVLSAGCPSLHALRMSPRIRLRTIVVALAATCVGASTAAAQADRAALSTRLDSIAGAAVAGNRAVGIVAAVVRGTDTLLMKSYGRADVEWNVPMPTDATFEIGSIAKQVTAVAVLQLRDAGKLSLDDDITKWLPDFDTRGNAVPLRRLLDHTSGIHGLTEMPEFMHLAI